jgi:hypothetical protein
MQYDLGYVKSESGAKEYAAAYIDEKSEDFDHMPCTRGQIVTFLYRMKN